MQQYPSQKTYWHPRQDSNLRPTAYIFGFHPTTEHPFRYAEISNTLLVGSVNFIIDAVEIPVALVAANSFYVHVFFLYRMAPLGGIEPLSSIPLLYATGLEDLCGDKGYYTQS